ncbi:MAG: membrane dipeptidase, partial [Sneathiella sp.]
MTLNSLTETFPWLQGAPIIDGLLPWSQTYLPEGADLLKHLARLRNNGFSHISFTLAGGQETAADALIQLGSIAAALRLSGAKIAHDTNIIRDAHKTGQLSASFHFQTSTPFLTSLDMVDAFYAAGVQRAILAYNDANPFADGCHETRNAGLSDRGRALVTRMDDVGMRIDLTHCGLKTSFDVLQMGLKSPPLFSHSNARALFEHERNLTDEQLQTAAQVGSYIGLNGVGMFLG